MAPLKEANTGSVAVLEAVPAAFPPVTQSPASKSKTLVTNKRIESLSLDGDSELRSSFQQLSVRRSELMEELEGDDSLVANACRDSLKSEGWFEEANILFESSGTKTSTIAPWRASLAHFRADSYLETIKAAIDHPCRERLDLELCSITNKISLHLPSRDALIKVSSWLTPSLAFDVTIGKPVQQIIGDQLPLKLKVTTIMEVLASDVDDGIAGAQPCTISLGKCRHSVLPFQAAGAVGDALVRVGLSPINGGGMLRVKEARVLQVNALPPIPKASIDLYTSEIHGSSDSNVILRFPTYSASNPVPEVHIELVVASS